MKIKVKEGKLIFGDNDQINFVDLDYKKMFEIFQQCVKNNEVIELSSEDKESFEESLLKNIIKEINKLLEQNRRDQSET